MAEDSDSEDFMSASEHTTLPPLNIDMSGTTNSSSVASRSQSTTTVAATVLEHSIADDDASMYTASELSEECNEQTVADSTPSSTSIDLTHSVNVDHYKGRFVPKNTVRQQLGSLKLFSIFVVRKDQFHTSGISWTDEKYLMEAKNILFKHGNSLVVSNESDSGDIPDEILIRLRFFLIEFVVNYRSKKKRKRCSRKLCMFT